MSEKESSLHLRKIIIQQATEITSLKNEKIALLGIIEELHGKIEGLESDIDFEILHRTKAEIELKGE